MNGFGLLHQRVKAFTPKAPDNLPRLLVDMNKLLDMAWKARCDTAADKLVLANLADRANRVGKCWPHLTRIAADCGLSKRACINSIARLERAGHLTVERRPGCGNRYIVHPKSGEGCSPVINLHRTSCLTDRA